MSRLIIVSKKVEEVPPGLQIFEVPFVNVEFRTFKEPKETEKVSV